MEGTWSEMIRFSLRWTASEVTDPALYYALERAEKHDDRLLSPPADSAISSYVAFETAWDMENQQGFPVVWAMPRLGTWQQQRLKELAPAEMEAVRQLVGQTVLCGYAAAILMEGAIRKHICRPDETDAKALYEAWLSLAADTRSGEAGRSLFSLDTALQEITPGSEVRVKERLGELGITLGLLARPRLSALVRRYVEHGALLRQVESAAYYRRTLYV